MSVDRMVGRVRQVGKTQLRVSELGFGAATLGNLYHPVSDAAARSAVERALAAGINHFDTAPYYGFGLSERRLGDALRLLPAWQYVLSTKVGRLLQPCGRAEDKYGFCSPMPFEPDYDYSYDGVMRSYEHSIQRLGLPRIDVLYMHDIGRVTHGDHHGRLFRIAMEGGYKAMDELRSQGLVQAIGLGVNEYQVCEQAMDHGDFDCFLLAGRYTLLEQDALDAFLPRCVKQKVSIVLGGPYNSGILATGVRREGVIPHYNYQPASAAVVNRVQRIEALCDEYGVSLAAAALQFPLAHQAVCSVIPGLNSETRVEQALGQMQEVIPGAFWLALKTAGLLHPEAPLPGMADH